MGSGPELGDTVRDEATGFSGKVTGVATYIAGDIRVQVSGLDADGRPIEYWFERGRLAVQEG